MFLCQTDWREDEHRPQRRRRRIYRTRNVVFSGGVMGSVPLLLKLQARLIVLIPCIRLLGITLEEG